MAKSQTRTTKPKAAVKATSSAAPARISLDELMRKAADPRTNPASLRKYFLLDEEETDAFAPQLKLNPATVNIPPTPEGKARGDMAINIANSTARMRRTLIFNQRIATGHDGPILVSEGDSWFEFPILLDYTFDYLVARGHAARILYAAGATLHATIKDRAYSRPRVDTARRRGPVL